MKQNPNYTIPKLPLKFDLESKIILKKTKEARASLAELKGVSGIIPNKNILISTLSLQEAKDSSAIESIITTHDELYQSNISTNKFATIPSKEVHNYALALRNGYEKVQKTKLLTNNHIKDIQHSLEENNAGFRNQAGTTLKNEQTEQIVYTPPQTIEQIESYMTNLEKFINEDELCNWDPLVKMAIIHHQFESIHPFFDGNGRTGRIINILYLVKLGLLDTPILYLSRFINQNKSQYYYHLQKIRETNSNSKEWENWILFILDGIYQTANHTISVIYEIKNLMQKIKDQIRKESPKLYSQDLLNHLFKHPYTKISFLADELNIHRNTAQKYLNSLAPKILHKHKIKHENFYVNKALYALLLNTGTSKK